MQFRTTHTVLILVLSAVLAGAPAAQGSDVLERDFKVESGQKVELEMDQGGSLDVEGWDKNMVRVVCVAHRNDIEDYDIEIDETRDGLRLTAELKDRRIQTIGLEIQLMVPRDFDIETHSGGGHITITGVTGDFRGRTGGGRITLRSVSGKANLSTGGGRIEILDSDLDGKVATGGGGGIVRNVTGNVKASSGGGIISYENVRDRHGDLRGPGRMSTEGVTQGTIMYTTAGGGIQLDEAPEGAIVQTGGGRIEILNASRMVDASTGGGDIRIEIDDGSVVARTGAGDIDVVVLDDLGDSRDGIDLSTGSGEITVVLPADVSVELDLDLSYTRNSRRSYDIKSDFDLDIEHTTEWESRHGNPRKHIYGTATINGGKHRVIIHSVNGDIRIKKR